MTWKSHIFSEKGGYHICFVCCLGLFLVGYKYEIINKRTLTALVVSLFRAFFGSVRT